MIPHSWILECLKMIGINKKIQSLLEDNMKSWWVELTCGKFVCEGKNKQRDIPERLSITFTIRNITNPIDQYFEKFKTL